MRFQIPYLQMKKEKRQIIFCIRNYEHLQVVIFLYIGNMFVSVLI